MANPHPEPNATIDGRAVFATANRRGPEVTGSARPVDPDDLPPLLESFGPDRTLIYQGPVSREDGSERREKVRVALTDLDPDTGAFAFRGEGGAP